MLLWRREQKKFLDLKEGREREGNLKQGYEGINQRAL